MHPASCKPHLLQAPHCCQALGCQPLSHTQYFLFYKDFQPHVCHNRRESLNGFLQGTFKNVFPGSGPQFGSSLL